MIIANNLLLLIAVSICMINNPWVILFGRFLYGMSAGTFTVMCPKFISEVAPTEYKGVFGAMSQFMCVFGIVAVTSMGLAAPNPITSSQSIAAQGNDTLSGTYLLPTN
jgi:MFS family permease